MDNNTIMLIVGFIGSMIPIFTVIVKLNSTITKLNLTIQVLNKQMENSQKDRTEIHTQLNNHETRIATMKLQVVINGFTVLFLFQKVLSI